MLNKVLIILLCSFSLSLAQYSNNFMNGGDSESFAGTADDNASDDWSNWNETSVSDPNNVIEATANPYTGIYAFKIKRTTSPPSLYQSSAGLGAWTETIKYVVWYRLDFWTRSASGTYTGRYRIIDASNGLTWHSTDSTWGSAVYPNVVGNTTTYAQTVDYFLTQNGTDDIWITFISAVAAGIYYIDDVSVRERLDSLFVYSTGSSVKFDTTNSMVDAVHVRKMHPAGITKIEAADYSSEGTITLTSSFTRWVADGTNYIFDTIDFASYSGEVDYYIYNGIATILNEENITIINTPVPPTPQIILSNQKEVKENIEIVEVK